MSRRTRYTKRYLSMRDHPVVGIEKDRPLSRHEAWQVGIIDEAAFTRHQIRLKGKMVWLERGQMPCGRDFLAKAWNWEPQKVRSFLTELEREGMITVARSGGHFPNILTVCNYDEYQGSAPVTQPAKQPVVNQRSTSAQPDIKKEYTGIETNNPPSPQGGDETRGKSFVTREAERAEREAKAAEEVAAMKAPKGEVNPYRPQNHNFTPQGDPKKVGAGWTEDGTLQLFNGAYAEGLAMSGSEEQLRIDLLVVQSSNKVGPSLNPTMLRSRALGVLAQVTDQRKQTDRRYAEACARNQKGRGAGAGNAPTPQEVMSSWVPTTDETILRERFAWFVTKTKGGKDLLRNAGQKATWESFRDRQLERARETA